jgi:very-short-patch-repair endonuclease
MNDFTIAALDVLSRHHGVSTLRMLRRAGLSRNRLQRLVGDGLLIRASETVYRLAGTPRTLEQRCVELCFAHPRSYITGPTAGVLIGLRRVGKPTEIHLGAPHGSNVGPIPGVRLRQTTKLPSWHLVRRSDGIVLASHSRLAFDLSVDLPPLDHVSVVEQLLGDPGCTPATLRRIAHELVHPARPGSAQFVAMIEQRLDGGPGESHGEVLIARGLRLRGIPVVAQYPVVLPGGRRVRFDLAVPSVKWAVEVDGFPDHFSIIGGSSDRRRDRWSHAAGWQVERVVPIDLVDLDGTCDDLAELYRHRCAEAA